MKVMLSCRMRKKDLRKLFCPCSKREKVVARIVTYSFNDVSFTAKGDNMSLTLKETDLPGSVTVSVQFVNAKGNPAKVDGVPVWSVTDPTIVDQVTPGADGMSAVLHLTGTVGASQVGVNADVDLGPGVTNKDFVDTISVLPAEAVAANFTFGAVTPDPV